jgi:hypothetical protein
MRWKAVFRRIYRRYSNLRNALIFTGFFDFDIFLPFSMFSELFFQLQEGVVHRRVQVVGLVFAVKRKAFGFESDFGHVPVLFDAQGNMNVRIVFKVFDGLGHLVVQVLIDGLGDFDVSARNGQFHAFIS